MQWTRPLKPKFDTLVSKFFPYHTIYIYDKGAVDLLDEMKRI